ncbi:MAG: hypothetical protein IPJ22_11265 [Bacteroidetes bacterium]|nr:hypothetical protein [Bacteroidota bacterium]
MIIPTEIRKGVAKVLPDSLRKSFKTKIGRIVKDGAGIEPDVKTEEELMADVTISLFENNHFFYICKFV